MSHLSPPPGISAYAGNPTAEGEVGIQRIRKISNTQVKYKYKKQYSETEIESMYIYLDLAGQNLHRPLFYYEKSTRKSCFRADSFQSSLTDSSRHGGVQPGGSPGGSALLHGSDGPGHLSRQIEPAARSPAGRQPRPLSGHPAGHRPRKTNQVLRVHRAFAKVPVLVSTTVKCYLC